jgi:hypothetical protein
MKKRTITKLRLDRETLRHLDPGSLQEVAAGAITVGCSGTCTATDPHGKPSVAAAGCN